MVEAVMLRTLLLLALLAFPSAASAHRLDEYLQATLVTIEPGEILLQINLTPGVNVADQVLALIDRDSDGVIPAKESAAYAELLKRELILRLDQRDVGLKLTGSNFPEPAELRTGFGIIQMEFTAMPTSLSGGAHTLSLENRHLPAASVYLFNSAKPRSGSVQITRQQRNRTQSSGEIAFIYQSPADISKVPAISVAFAALFVSVFAIRRRLKKGSK